MRALFTKKTIIIASAAILIAVLTIVSINVAGTSGAVTGTATAVSGPLRQLTSYVARTFESIYGSIYRYDQLVDDYERLLKDYAALREASREAAETQFENERLYALFDFRDRHAGQQYERATILSWSGSNWSSSFLISKGHANSDKEVKVGDSVITEYGVLIGRITAVGATSSTVISILDTTFSAGAFIGEGGDSATAKGDFSLMNRGLLMLDRIPEGASAAQGDAIVTSGIGGIFPTGLVIGEVVDVFAHSTGIGRYATIRPMLPHLESIAHVFVITEFDVAE